MVPGIVYPRICESNHCYSIAGGAAGGFCLLLACTILVAQRLARREAIEGRG